MRDPEELFERCCSCEFEEDRDRDDRDDRDDRGGDPCRHFNRNCCIAFKLFVRRRFF